MAALFVLVAVQIIEVKGVAYPPTPNRYPRPKY
jgi:hypothetical protein